MNNDRECFKKRAPPFVRGKSAENFLPAIRTSMSASMSLQIKCIVKTFTAERAKITFNITVTLQMSVKESL